MTAPRVRTDEPAASAPAKRGPRRSPVRLADRPVADPDLEALRKLLLASVAGHYPQADIDPVSRAYDLAVEAHAGQRRATGAS